MKNLFIILLMFISFQSWSQNINASVTSDTLVWKSDKIITKRDSSTVTIPCEFTTQAASTVFINIGTMHHEFHVWAFEGIWNNVTDIGSITYYINEEKSWFLIIERKTDGLFFTLDLTADGGTRSVYIIQSVNFY